MDIDGYRRHFPPGFLSGDWEFPLGDVFYSDEPRDDVPDFTDDQVLQLVRAGVWPFSPSGRYVRRRTNHPFFDVMVPAELYEATDGSVSEGAREAARQLALDAGQGTEGDPGGS